MTKWENAKKLINKQKTFKMSDLPKDVGYNYINYMRAAGFISRTERGTYFKNLTLPDDLTLKDVKEYAYGSKQGQVKLLIRKEKLIKLDEELS